MQWALTTLFISAVLVGAFAFYLRMPPPENQPTIARAVMDQTGLSQESVNLRTIKKFSVTVQDGIAMVREQMDSVREKNEQLLQYVEEQNRNLKMQGRNVHDLIAELSGRRVSAAELTRLKSVADALDNQSRLLVDRGDELVKANERIRADMDDLRERMEQVRQTGRGSDGMALVDRMTELSERQAAAIAKAKELSSDAQAWSSGVKDKLGTGGAAGQDDAMRAAMERTQQRQDEVLERIRNNRLAYEAKQEAQQAKAERKAEEYRAKAENNQQKMEDARQKAADQMEAFKERMASHARD